MSEFFVMPRVDPHDQCREAFGDDVDKVRPRLYWEFAQRNGVGRIAKLVENDPSFTLGVEYGILATLDALARSGRLI